MFTRKTIIACVSLMALPSVASATTYNEAVYSVSVNAVQAPNTFVSNVAHIGDSQQSYPYPESYLNPPVPVEVHGSANTGPNYSGLGYANGIAFARAEAGVLKASTIAEAQATAQPSTNVGASVSVSSLADFYDRVTFTSTQVPSQSTLFISGGLLLDGPMYSYGTGYGEVSVGGTGVSNSSSIPYWRGTSSGLQSLGGKYSSWVPGSTVTIPFSFSVLNGESTQLDYWLSLSANASADYSACASAGGLCNIVQTTTSLIHIDYCNTLAWGGVSVTDQSGKAVSFSSSSISGFDYAVAYSSPVPVPAAAWLFGSGLLGLIGVARRRIQAA